GVVQLLFALFIPPPPPPISLLPPVPLTSLPSISCLLFSLALLIDMLDRASRETIGYSLQKCSIADGIVSIRSKKEMIIQLCWKERRQAEREEETRRGGEEKGRGVGTLFSSVDNDPKLSVDDTVMPQTFSRSSVSIAKSETTVTTGAVSESQSQSQSQHSNVVTILPSVKGREPIRVVLKKELDTSAHPVSMPVLSTDQKDEQGPRSIPS
ncbi:hypothetical protein ADUPG1_003581, partial [Aduncisulcus paluster]